MPKQALCQVYNRVLHGCGSAGLETLKSMRDIGIFPVCFADNDAKKHGELIAGIKVLHPKDAQITYPLATWVVSIYRAEARDVRDQLRGMGVRVEPLGTHRPAYQPMPDSAFTALVDISTDLGTVTELEEQIRFRATLDYDRQPKPSPISELYFPPFIRKIENEVFVDCGAYDGDSIRTFLNWQPKPETIFAFEADPVNFKKLNALSISQLIAREFAISDFAGRASFTTNGDFSSHLGTSPLQHRIVVQSETLDRLLFGTACTFIKMDIEGSELRALWGARRILKETKPVLAICAYHEPDHLFEIPLLIHAIQPDYELRLRRYAEGTRELVWYGIPRERLL